MRLLLTRAGEDAARTAARLAAMGHEVLTSPVISFETTGAKWQGPAPDGLIATSARAFMGVERGQSGWAAVPLYLVGHRTEVFARAMGLMGPAVTAADSAALCVILRSLPPARLAYLAGTDRKSTIEDDIVAGQRHQLHVVETYRAVAAEALAPEVIAALRAGEMGGVLHFSRRSAEIFLHLAATAGVSVTGVRHYCLSRDVTGSLLEAAGGDIRIASHPDEAGLLALLTD